MKIKTRQATIRVAGEGEDSAVLFGLIPDGFEGMVSRLSIDEQVYYWLDKGEWERLKVGDEYGEATIVEVSE